MGGESGDCHGEGRTYVGGEVGGAVGLGTLQVRLGGVVGVGVLRCVSNLWDPENQRWDTHCSGGAGGTGSLVAIRRGLDQVVCLIRPR